MKQENVIVYLNDAAFRARVQYCLTKCIMDITNEPDGAPKKAKRLKLATKVLSSNLDITPAIMMVLAHNNFDLIDDPRTATDAQMEEAVAATIPFLLFSLPD